MFCFFFVNMNILWVVVVQIDEKTGRVVQIAPKNQSLQSG
jgi:hypothetical protein